jgi:hypothetical protein
LTSRHAEPSNGWVKPESSDLISSGPRWISGRAVRMISTGAVLVALAVAVLVVVHDNGEVAALRRQLQAATRPRPALIVVPHVSTAVYPLPPDGSLTGEVTVFFTQSLASARVVLTARISGGRPHTLYHLVGSDCLTSAGYRFWASGVSDARGIASLTGPGWVVLPGDYYFLELSPSVLKSGPGLHGPLASADDLSAIHDGFPPCAPTP